MGLKSEIKKYKNFIKNAPKFQELENPSAKIREELFEFYVGSVQLFRNILTIRDIPVVEMPKGIDALYNIIGHGETDWNDKDENKRLTGNLGPGLNKDGVKLAIDQYDPNRKILTLSSDIPRALHHAILRQDKTKKEDLETILGNIDSEQGVISKEVYEKLIDIAFEVNVYPTPLLRAQYFGPMEGFNRIKDTHLIEESKVRRKLNNVIVEDNDELSESYVHFMERGFAFLRMFANETGIIIPSADFVTHSGFLDIARAYFRYLNSIEEEESGEIRLERTKDKGKRGEIWVFKLNKNLDFLNDSLGAKYKALEKADEWRKRSLDDKIREEDTGIVKTPLKAFKKKDNLNEHESYKTDIKEALDSQLPIIIFGHGGQGKTILATETTKKLIKQELGEEYSKYIPVLINCDNLSRSIIQSDKESTPENIAKLMKKDVEKIFPYVDEGEKFLFLIDDYHKLTDYYNFVKKAIDILKEDKKCLPIIFSRLEKMDIHPPVNEGYLTMQIDRDSIPNTIDDFMQDRMDEDKYSEFKEYVSQYDESITGNFITLYALTRIFDKSRKVLDCIDEKKYRAICKNIKEGEPINKRELYEVETAFVSSSKLRRKDANLSRADMLKDIEKEKKELAQFAFDKHYGKKDE